MEVPCEGLQYLQALVSFARLNPMNAKQTPKRTEASEDVT